MTPLAAQTDHQKLFTQAYEEACVNIGARVICATCSGIPRTLHCDYVMAERPGKWDELYRRMRYRTGEIIYTFECCGEKIAASTSRGLI